MTQADQLFRRGDDKALWQKYCGFLDLSLEEFMNIQEDLLREQIELVAGTPIGKKIMNGNSPSTAEEFRKVVPLTTYADYKDFLLNKSDDALCAKAYMWARTSGRTGEAKWIPEAERAWEKNIDYVTGALILACASNRGDVNMHAGDHILYNLAPRPYLSGFMAHSAIQRAQLHGIPPVEAFEKLTFQERIELGFNIGLRTGIDVVASMASVLVKIGESFANRSGSTKLSLGHPAVLWRLVRAFVRSRIAKRALLPKDLWNIKGIASMGTDAAIYKDQIKYYWGVTPIEFYAASEIGFLAVQAWNKKSMTFVPASSFLEFIPENEWLKNREDHGYIPKTVLINQVEPGKIYELVATPFYGMPFLRYRIGDMIKVVSMRDEAAGINLPQIAFHARADDLIDVASFARLDERTVWTAITSADIKYEDWTLRKEHSKDNSIQMRLYIEVKDGHSASEIEEKVHKQLRLCSADYNSMAEMLETNPIRVTLLPTGTFRRYMEIKQAAGVDPGWLKPTHINARDQVIAELLQISQTRT